MAPFALNTVLFDEPFYSISLQLTGRRVQQLKTASRSTKFACIKH